jgi:hypothetical protein
MSLNSILKPDQSVMLGLASGGVIMAIYNGALPSQAMIRTADPHDGDIESTRKMAAWTSAGLLSFMFLLTRDRNAFLIGGMVLAGVDYLVKHSNGMNPTTGKLSAEPAMGAAALDDTEAAIYPMPGYTDDVSEVV